MPPKSVARRLYFAQDAGRTVCVGIDGYAGPYFASETLRVPEDLDPVGMTTREIEDAEAAAIRERSLAFVASRRRAAA